MGAQPQRIQLNPSACTLSSGNTMEKGQKDGKIQRTRKSSVRLYLLEMTGKPHHDTSTTWLPKQNMHHDNINRHVTASHLIPILDIELKATTDCSEKENQPLPGISPPIQHKAVSSETIHPKQSHNKWTQRLYLYMYPSLCNNNNQRKRDHLLEKTQR